MSSSSSSDHNKKRYQYDVFLSFSGEDTRRSFVDHLFEALQHHAIRTFKDDERLQKGKQITDELLKSIDDSRFSLIVFSKKYASSSWCLDELVKIMECQKKTDQSTVFPVFYDVEPTEVRHQSGSVGEAFAKHTIITRKYTRTIKEALARHTSKKIGKWRKALKDAANLSGWEVKKTAHGHEAKVIKLIVERISLELRSINTFVDENLIGMEPRMQALDPYLEIGSDDVRIIGIKGMGGAGKTTLARAIFDKISFHFEGKSFVENVREKSKAPLLGLEKLQEQVLTDVLTDKSISVSSVHVGTNLMKTRLCGKKVLVVLDDVDHINQLEALAGDPSWFKQGSRIIITTRDEQVLIAHRVRFIQDVQLLSDEEAIHLFSRHAFREAIPTQEYERQSLDQVVRYAAGLPLTIKVLGSHLCGQGKLEWADTLLRLKTIPLKETIMKLEISYDSLEDDYKEIFLDVACFCRCMEEDDAILMLESCGYHARNGLKVLQHKSLIKIDVDYEDRMIIEMHDHIEEMGKNIVRREHKDEPHKHSRLWVHEEIKHILAKNLGGEATRCIDIDYKHGVVLENLRKMKKLRCLTVHHLWTLESEINCEPREYFPNSLQYLSWEGYPHRCLPKTFEADNLVTLQMTHSNIKQLWNEGRVMKKLKFLFLDFSKLKSLDLGLMPNLERLNLEGCSDLEKVYVHGGCLKSLVYLTLSCCKKLRSLDLGMMPSLESLTISNCNDLVKLDVHGGCLKSLVYLTLSGCKKLRSLDLGMMPSLESLNLFNCNDLVKLDVHGGCLKSLNLLDCCKLKIPDLGLMPNLERLHLEPCYDLVKLDVHGGCLKSLVYLNLSHCKNLRRLDLGMMPSLQELNLESCYDLVKLDLHGGCLKSLDYLKLLHCKNLRRLDLGLMPNLKTLNLKFCYDLVKLDLHGGCLKSLYWLDLSHCKNLRSLDLGMMPSLWWLNLENCSNLEKLYVHGGCLKSLVNLSLSSCHKLKSPDLGLMPNLVTLNLESCYDLVKLDVHGGCLKSLVYLNLSSCHKLKSPDLGLMPNLETLNLESCYDLVKLDVHGGCLKSLVSLNLSHCKNLRRLDLGMMPSLQRLNLESCYDLVKLYVHGGCLKSLVYLNLSGCKNLKSTLFIEHLESLEVLYLDGWNLKEFPNYIITGQCNNSLLELQLSQNFDIEELPLSIGNLHNLVSLNIHGYRRLEILPRSICSLQHLRTLKLVCTCIKKLPDSIGQLECLKKLDLSCSHIERLPGSICKLKHLKNLILYQCDLLEMLPDDVGQLESLEELNLAYCSRLRDIPSNICKLKLLEDLKLYGCRKLEKLPHDMGNLQCLQILDIRVTGITHLPPNISLLKGLKIYKSDVKDADFIQLCFSYVFKEPQIQGFQQLRKLDLRGCGIKEVPDALGHLELLETLNLSYTDVKNLPDSICMLKHLKNLFLASCVLLEKLPDNIGELESLEGLSLSKCYSLREIPSSIYMLKQLKILSFWQCFSLEKLPEEIDQLESLEMLCMRKCYNIRQIPKSICLSKKLKILDLEGCRRLEKLPDDIGYLQCLQVLDIWNTAISPLPQSIFLLNSLKLYGFMSKN